MNLAIIILLVLALLLFIISAFFLAPVTTREKLVTIGLACLAGAFLLMRWAAQKGVVLSIACAFLFASCAGLQDAMSSPAAKKVLTSAVQVLGQFAVDSLLGTAKMEIAKNGNKDMAHSAAQGVWSKAVSWVTGKGIELAVNSFSNRELPKTADAAKDAFNASSAPPAAKANAIAAVISTAAGAPPK
jgi:hypothetical protein